LEVIFVEVKSGSARLNHNEHSLKDVIDNKRVRRRSTAFPLPSLTPTPHRNPSDDAEGIDAPPLAAILSKL
jgi:hypothetical protein